MPKCNKSSGHFISASDLVVQDTRRFPPLMTPSLMAIAWAVRPESSGRRNKPFFAIHAEIIEFQKIVTSANFRPMTEAVEIRAMFEKDGEKTNFTFSVVHPTEEYCKQQEQMGFYNGWGSAFTRLETFLISLTKNK